MPKTTIKTYLLEDKVLFKYRICQEYCYCILLHAGKTYFFFMQEFFEKGSLHQKVFDKKERNRWKYPFQTVSAYIQKLKR